MFASPIQYLLTLAHDLFSVSWTGALIFYIAALYPAISRFKEIEKLTFNIGFFKYSQNFLRIAGIFTIISGFLVYLYPNFSFSNFLSLFQPNLLLLGLVLSLVAYFAIGEAFIIPSMKKYIAVGVFSIRNKLPQISPHTIVLEKRVVTFIFAQLVIVATTLAIMLLS